MKLSLIALFACLSFSASAYELKVTVTGLKSTRGVFFTRLWCDQKNFTYSQGANSHAELDQIVKIPATTFFFTLKDLNPKVGTDCALVVFHDANVNNVLDKNWMGVPKESFGFSNFYKRVIFRQPSWNQINFDLKTTDELTIRMMDL